MAIVTINISHGTTVEGCNGAVSNAVKGADILLLSDDVFVHGGCLEHLQACLYAAEKHAVACGQEIDAALIETAGKYLPQYSRIVRPTVCCTLIRRALIDRFGFLDAAFETLQYALMDFYMRINDFGYTAVVAHHAFYSVDGSCQTLAPHLSVEENNIDEKLFAERYEHFERMEKHYARAEVHPCLRFLELLSEKTEKKSILFECRDIAPWHNGTSEYQISLFDAFVKLFEDKYDIYICVKREADAFHRLSERCDNVLYPDTMGDKVFHLGFVPNQLTSTQGLLGVGNRCLKIMQTVLDVIVLRCHEHHKGEMSHGDAMRIGFRYCDGIITISETCKRDLQAYFRDDANLGKMPIKSILPASNACAAETAINESYEVPFSEYFLIVGNAYRHKAIKQAIEVAGKTAHNYIVIGCGDNKYIKDNIYGYRSGWLDDVFLAYLYANCAAVIFPSLYEGFGLPVTTAFIHSKRVVLGNTEVNRELYEHFAEFRDHFLFFDRFEEIAEIVEGFDFSVALKPVQYEDTWDRAATETESFFAEILDAEIDVDRLNARRHMYNAIASAIDKDERLQGELAEMRAQLGGYKLLPLLHFAVKENVKHRHPKVFALTKRPHCRRIKGTPQ